MDCGRKGGRGDGWEGREDGIYRVGRVRGRAKGNQAVAVASLGVDGGGSAGAVNHPS